MIAANTGFLFKDRPFLERIALAAEHGFDAVEFHDEAQAHSVEDVRAALREAGLPLLGLNARMGDTAGRAGVPGEEARAAADVDHAIETARALGGRAVHVLAGRTEGSEDAWTCYVNSLRHGADAAPDLTILIEPLCERAMPGYLLPSVADASRVIERVGRDNVRIMFDVFHVAGNGDDIAPTYRAHERLVGHVQIADPVTRHEPSAALLRDIRAMGWRGAVGAEYVPTGDFGWLSDR